MLMISCRGLGFIEQEAETIKSFVEHTLGEPTLQGFQIVEFLEELTVAEMVMDALVTVQAKRSLATTCVAIELRD